MKAIQIATYGAPESLRVIESTAAAPSEGQVTVKTAFAGVNFADIMARRGMYADAPPAPFVPGYEISGHVSASRSPLFKEGDPVVVLTRFGGYADSLTVQASQAFKVPAGLTMQEAAALPVNYLTAWQLMVVMGSLKAGETVLVHNAGGGVGLAALDLARHLDAVAVGTASAGKHAFLLERGYRHLVDYRRKDWPDEVRKITGGRGADLILDPVGGPNWGLNYLLLRSGGRLGMFGVSHASASGGRTALGLLRLLPHFRFWNPAQLMNQNKSVFGVNIGRMWHETARVGGWMEAILRGVEEGWIRPLVDSVHPFSKAAEAHRRLEERRNTGKVLLQPD